MLLVKTYLAPSAIHGVGVFAGEPIARGTVIWRFDARIDRLLTRAEREALSEPARSFVETYAFPETPDSDIHVLCGDDARFMNHSDRPNTDNPGDTIAARDIAPGEELLCDYGQFHPEHRLARN